MQINGPTVAAVDGSSATRSMLAWAAEYASLHRSPVRLVTVLDPNVRDAGYQADTQQLLDVAARFVEKSVGAIRAVEVTTAILTGPVGPALIRESSSARLLVLGRSHSSAAPAHLLESPTTTLVRRSRCPVAIVPGEVKMRTYSPVVVGIDGTRSSTGAIEFAFAEAARRDVPLVTLHARNSNGDSLALGLTGGSVAIAHEMELAESLAGWREQYPDVEVARQVATDSPVRNLIEQSRDAQMVVVGSRGRCGFSALTEGSTSQALVHAASCPIVVVPQIDQSDRTASVSL
ncbi:universal stress protein [Smaragdicoccus niigatensis]|uniref:universal stress protein n=1 Tax=Smaragdicoccus niigatensis TaxID=359359 RepID=UPI00036182E5|nr:universal stress protein [Smaragdicoccus niigatensis]